MWYLQDVPDSCSRNCMCIIVPTCTLKHYDGLYLQNLINSFAQLSHSASTYSTCSCSCLLSFCIKAAKTTTGYTHTQIYTRRRTKKEKLLKTSIYYLLHT